MTQNPRRAGTLLASCAAAALLLGGCAPGEDEPHAEPGVEEPWAEPGADTPPPTAADTGATRPPPDPPRETPPTQADREADLEAAEELRREEGLVGVTGTGVAPTAILRLDGGGSLGLTGELAREIRRLSGARVLVEGREAATPVGRGLEVTGYEILEIDGRRPLVGVLQRVEEAWHLVPDDEAEDAVELLGLVERGIEEGMKIWVTGRETEDGRFRVESHGIVLPAP